MKEIDVIMVGFDNSKKIEQSSIILDNMLSNKRSPFEINGVGYNPNPTL
jgi:hypothetical protein